jgi:hypothetical protein
MITDKTRRDLTPQGYIRHMFAATENGKFTVEYKDREYGFEDYEKTFQVNWTEEDAEKTVEKYNLLTFALARIGRLHDQLGDEESRKNLLSEGDLEIWNTYVRPYEPLEVDWDKLHIDPCTQEELMQLVEDAYWRGRYGDLFEEEELLLQWHWKWQEEQSQKRIPFNRRSCANLILRAMRYEKLISLGAPEIVVTEEGRWLAEEMVLYYFGKEEPIVWE